MYNNLRQYLPGESPVHRRDPRVKIIAVVALSLITLHTNPVGLALVFVVVAGVILVAQIPPVSLLTTLKPVMPLFILLFLLHLFFTPGTPLPPFPIGLVSITYEGLYQGLFLVGKFLLLVVAASVLTLTTSPSELTMGMERLLRPLRFVGISSHDLAMMLSLALRFMPILLEESSNIKEAQLARGAVFNSGGPLKKARAISSLVIPLSTGIFRRCEELINAMEARGYQPGPRTYLKELTFDPGDYLVLAVVLLITVVAVLL
ncbi:MAG: ABC-type cobalt transport system, permease component CbiQ [Thermoanaerobacterales bacterium 50_218]|nr:MAG: ABC-type cobalt transport system, permease component CbiQ [Thermoanaerobacterales bacterium 50_218]HAA89536.1 energy-coupling factor transporter transmembrane protein EcfT [Peptococcaceae bacterium]